MKTLFIEAEKKHFEKLDSSIFSGLPEKIGLIYTIQYKPLFEKVKEMLEKQGKKVFIGKGALNEGQIIGCNIQSALSIQEDVDCFVLISSGKFHAFSLALHLGKPIYIIRGRKIEQLEREEIELIRKKRKAAVSKFLLSDKIGIIVSTKPGQCNMQKALEIKEKLSKEKKVFLFISDTINPKELENFRIDFWINTACPGLAFDIQNMLNLSDYLTIENFK
jgi:2-(3-amino-3-carboxypropyl)histidine synthase